MKNGFCIIFAFLFVVSLQAQEPEKDDFLILPGTGIVATEGVEGAGYSVSLQGSYFFWERSSIGLRMSFVYNTRDIGSFNEDVLIDFNTSMTYDYCFASSYTLSAHIGGGIGFASLCSFSADTKHPDQLELDRAYKSMLSLYSFLSIRETNAIGVAFHYIPSTAYNLSGKNYSIYHSYFEITYSLALWGS